MKNFFKRYTGIFAGALYALILRLVFNVHGFEDAFSLISVTFIWITPIVIGLIPLLYASKEQLQNWGFRISSPLWTVLVFFSLCFLTRIEDFLCLWIILLPYMLAAVTVGLIAGEIIQRIKNKKGTLYSIILIPFILSPIEEYFESPANTYSVVTSVVIHARPGIIWNNIIRVPQIDENEYNKGFFNYAGIPRPLYAELDKDTIGATRTGHFEGGLLFIEKVTSWNRNKDIGFDLSVVPSSIRQTIFDQHILQGDHFKFINVNYTLKSLGNFETVLTLSSSYQLKTNVNSYASYCGNQLLTDFQERLLMVIKTRCDNEEKKTAYNREDFR